MTNRTVLAYLAQPPRAVLAGNLVCLIGLIIVLVDQQGEWHPNQIFGIALFLCSALMWGSFAFFVRRWNISANSALIIIGSLSPILFLPVYFYFRGLSVMAFEQEAIVLQLVYQGLLVGIVAAFLYPYAINVLGSTNVASLSPAMPLLATLLGMWFLAEYPSNWQWAGVAVVTIGLGISQIGPNIANHLRLGRLPYM
ncbi:MAG: DMT family transporter [Gammaproteobacteria bacterium]|nr:DMT family transporter [Gammaproteobacteria bacterium]